MMSLKVDKSTIGIPKKCVKLAANHIPQARIFPDNRKTSKVSPVDTGADEIDPLNYLPISTLRKRFQAQRK